MHITKNVLESLLGTLMNMPEKTKDGPKQGNTWKIWRSGEISTCRPIKFDEGDGDGDSCGPSVRKVNKKEENC